MIKLEEIRRHAALRPYGDALVDGSNRLSWQDFEQAVDRVASGLQRLLPGGASARLAYLAGNRWELAVLAAACATLAVPCTGLDPVARPRDLARVLDQLQPDLLCVADQQLAVLEDARWSGRPGATEIRLDGSGPQAPARPGAGPQVAFQQLLTGDLLERTPRQDDYQQLVVVPGAPPRLARRPTAGQGSQLLSLVEEFGFDANEVHLAAAPLWLPGADDLTRSLLALGATVVLADGADPVALAEILLREHVTTAVITADALTALLAAPASAPLPSAALRCLVVPGRHVGRWLLNTAWERLGPVLHLAYAAPETGLVLMAGPEESQVTPVRTGRPALGGAIAVVGPDGRPVPAGTPGRIAVAGPQVMDGYLNGQAEFVELDLGGGPLRFLISEERGRQDDQGRTSLTGRTAPVPEVVRDQALDAALFQLESDLLNLPCLRDTAVMRVSLPSLGDALVVPFIAVAVGREATGYAALSAACASRAPSLTAHVIAVDTIPYGPSGRIRAAELLESVVPIITLKLQLEQSTRQEATA